MYKLDLGKVEEPEIKLATFTGSSKKQENTRKTSASASLTVLKQTEKPDVLQSMGSQRVRHSLATE